VTTVARAAPLSEREWQELLHAQGRPCACAAGKLCLGHYSVLDNASRARARRAAGIADFEGRRY
jgi:hypothetical protein